MIAPRRWWILGMEFLQRVRSVRPGCAESVRILAPERISRSVVETVRRLAEDRAPMGLPIKLYLLPQSDTPLYDLTCCFAPSRGETVSFHRALLTRGGRRRELTQRIDELFARCLRQPSIG
jgi:hypothetical protein